MLSKKQTLLAVCAFNTLTAALGGIGLIVGFVNPPDAWIKDTIFRNYTFPGIVLGLVVGGSALVATLGIVKSWYYSAEIAALSGLVMMGWIITEIAVIKHFSLLQVLYLLIGLAVILLASPRRVHTLHKNS